MSTIDIHNRQVTHDPHEAVQLAQRMFILGGQPTEIQQEIPLELSPSERRDVAVIALRVSQLFGD